MTMLGSDEATQQLPVVPGHARLVQQWRLSLFEAIRQTERSLARWRERRQMVAQLTARMNEYMRNDYVAADRELRSALEDYGFWQREVVRYSQQILAVCALEASTDLWAAEPVSFKTRPNTLGGHDE